MFKELFEKKRLRKTFYLGKDNRIYIIQGPDEKYIDTKNFSVKDLTDGRTTTIPDKSYFTRVLSQKEIKNYKIEVDGYERFMTQEMKDIYL